MKTFLVGLMILLAIPAGLLTYLHFRENTKVRFATVDEARLDGVIGHGLVIPEGLLPEGASDITLQVNTDTNERWLTFSFVGPPIPLRNCTSNAKLDVDAVRGPWWWSRAATDIARNAEKYRCIDRRDVTGYGLLYDCVLVIGSSKGAWSCDSGKEIPK